jgi:hypothetical protein
MEYKGGQKRNEGRERDKKKEGGRQARPKAVALVCKSRQGQTLARYKSTLKVAVKPGRPPAKG